jgi:hypothetical protein
LKAKTRSNVLVRIFFHLGVDDRIVNSYNEVANVLIFESRLENNDIIIVRDDIVMLLVSTTDPIDYNEETYFVAYSDNEKIVYTYITTFERLLFLFQSY